MKYPLLAAIACLALTACGPSKEVVQMRTEMDQLQPQQADLSASMQQLRQEVAVLRGQLDDLKHSAEQLGGFEGIGEKISLHQKSLDIIANEFALDLPKEGAQPAQEQASTEAATPPAAHPTQPEEGVRRLDESATFPAPPAPTAKTAADASTATKTDGKKSTTANTAETAKQLYDQGYQYYTMDKFKEAIASFEDLTKTYPKSTLVPNAWFWKGQSYFAMRRYNAAVLAYEQVISKYPKSNKAALSYLRQGMAFSRLNNNEAAKIRLNEVIRKFPNSTEAKRAKSFIKSMK